MDYFTELLESYSKLKKRTFKLTYIMEQEDGQAYAELIRILSGAVPGGFVSIQSPEYPDLTKFDYRRTADNGINVRGNYGKGVKQATLVTATGQQVRDKEAAVGLWDALFKAMAGEGPEQTPEQSADDAIAQQQAAEQQERLEKLSVPGGAMELEGFDLQDLKAFMQAQEKVSEYVSKFCSTITRSLSIKNAAQALCRAPGNYIGGNSRSGWEYKLSKGVGIKIDPESGLAVGSGQLSPDLLNAVAESHAQLIAFIAGDGDCDTIADNVGTYKKRLVIFGADQSEGVTIEPNALQKGAMEAIEKQCGELDLASVAAARIDTNTVNAVKGTFNELVLQLAVRLRAAKTTEQKKAAFKEIAIEINDKRKFLTEYAKTNQATGDIARDLDETFSHDVLIEQAGIAADNEALKNWFIKELSFAKDFVNMMQADEVRASGREVKTGGRADTELVYEDKDRAEAAAKLIDASVKEVDGRFVIGIGQKRLKELKATKLGEINRTARMLELFTELAKADKNLQAGFFKTIRDMQFAGDENRFVESRNYLTNLEGGLEEKTSVLVDPKTYVDETGKIHATSPEEQLKLIGAKVKDIVDYETLKDSTLGKALLKQNGDYRDFSDPSTQRRVKELLTRETRFRKLKEDIGAGNQAAKDALVRMAMICGANTDDMGQVITVDSGETYAFSHNEAFKRICEANNSGNLSIDITGTTAVMSTPEGITITFSQEGTSSGQQRNTRSVTKVSADTIKALNKNKKSTNEGTLEKFLRGQLSLLENLLVQIN